MEADYGFTLYFMQDLFAFLPAAIVLVALVLFSMRRGGVSRDLLDAQLAETARLRTELEARERELRDAHAQLAARDQAVIHLENALRNARGEQEESRRRLNLEFENLANRLLEEKSRRFTRQNAEQLDQILQPLRDKIREFEQNVDRKFLEDTREKAGLKQELLHLRELNLQLSQDAHNLASALKGKSKIQGDWGEFQLETLLEKAGLQRGIHFTTQITYRDDEGAAKRPDFVLLLPDRKHLIIDAKVSLTAFERYFNEPDPAQRERHLRAHLNSLRQHVQDLSGKKYQHLENLYTPDYLLLFIPLENALHTATEADPQLYTDALERNIILVTTSSLLATLRTVAHLWKQEKQTRSVLEISKQSGLLYDKFVAFVEDLREIGSRMDAARTAYDAAMHKLTHGPRPGDTLVGRAERIRQLGARTSKQLPLELIEPLKEETDSNPPPAGSLSDVELPA